jgi:hypothetical protein
VSRDSRIPNRPVAKPSNHVQTVTVAGARLNAEVTDSVLTASISDTIDGVTELALTINDPGFVFLTSGLFAPNTKVVWGQQKLVVCALEVSGGQTGRGEIQVQCRPQVVEEAKQKRGPKVFAKTGPGAAAQLLIPGKVVYETSTKRTNIAVNGPSDGEAAETYWEAISRWADEAGMIVFESWGTVFVGRPTWIAKQVPSGPPIVWAGPDSDDHLLEVPQCRRTINTETEPVTVSVSMHPDLAVQYRAGMPTKFSGVPGFAGDYWVTSVSGPLDVKQPWTLELAVPVDPKPSGDQAEPVKNAGQVGGSKKLASQVVKPEDQPGGANENKTVKKTSIATKPELRPAKESTSVSGKRRRREAIKTQATKKVAAAKAPKVLSQTIAPKDQPT